ncbi:MAG TPA: hydrogenase expression/formation protein HypE [Clostridia bacterium]|nr:hydrogenase expression/formation protein HypE [Clostridia bacterium]
MTDAITMAHGSGGKAYRELVEEIFLPAFRNEYLLPLTDSAVLPGAERLAFTTDGYVVQPLFFPGGDIGRLAISGTVNDLAVSGAIPSYIAASMVLAAGLPIETLRRVVASMAETAREAGVLIVTGDTKVVPATACDGIHIVTSGVGVFPAGAHVPLQRIEPGDAIVISSPAASHGMAVMAARGSMGFDPPIESDVRPMADAVRRVLEAGVFVHAMRDPTRGGVAATLCEWAGRDRSILIDEEAVPVRADAKAACAILGLDPLYVANEGVILFAVAKGDARRALAALHALPCCRDAAVIGEAAAGEGTVAVRTPIGTLRRILPPHGEQLPRIC